MTISAMDKLAEYKWHNLPIQTVNQYLNSNIETGLNSAQSNPTCASSEVPVRNSVKMKSLKRNNEPVYWTELTSLGYNPDSR